MELLQTFYETTLTALQEAKNDRLWFKTNLKLGKLWFDREEYTRLQRILKELNKSCQGPDGAMGAGPLSSLSCVELDGRAAVALCVRALAFATHLVHSAAVLTHVACDACGACCMCVRVRVRCVCGAWGRQ